MATFSKTGKEVVMVVDRRGIHRAHKLDATLEHYHTKFRFHFLPAHCGHHLNPLEGFWRVMKDASAPDGVLPISICYISAHARYSWRIKSDRFMSSTGSLFRLGLRGICFYGNVHFGVPGVIAVMPSMT